MNEKDSLVNEAATYDDLTKLTKEVRSLLDGRVSPGVVLFSRSRRRKMVLIS